MCVRSMAVLIRIVLLLVVMAKRGSSHLQVDDTKSKSQRSRVDNLKAKSQHGPTQLTDAERTDLRSDLIASSKSSKAGLATVLHTLHERGLLTDDRLGENSVTERNNIREAVSRHANYRTPFGTVVQPISIIVDGKRMAWDIISPFALLWYLCKVCGEFEKLMATTLRAAADKLHLIFYGDELTPGNPLRVDGGRQAFNFYYCFLEFPDFMKHRKDGWLCFGSLRTSIIHKLQGGVGGLVNKIFRFMFVDGYANFTKGFHLPCANDVHIVTATFEGTIADEKGLKEFNDIKGQGGTKCCISCKNVENFVHEKKGDARSTDAYFVGVDCVDRRKFVQHSNESIYYCASLVEAAVARHDGIITEDVKTLQTDLGVNYNPDGILYCNELKPILRPKDNYIRDWQHTLASSGVAGTELSGCLTAIQTCKTLKDKGIGLHTIEAFTTHFHLPATRGKINTNWFISWGVCKIKHLAYFGWC